LAGCLGAHIRAHDPAAPDHFTFLGAHGGPLQRPWGATQVLRLRMCWRRYRYGCAQFSFRSLPIKQSTGDSLVSNEAIYRKNTEVVQPPLGIPHR
jgi:hypothetical protein